jgi:hypothetical protein
LVAPRPASADPPLARFEASVDGTGWLLSVDFDPPLTTRLEDALAPVMQLRNWRIELPADLEPGRYLGRVRLRLDSGQLPKPVRIDALTNRDLYPQAEWTSFPVLIPTPTSGR